MTFSALIVAAGRGMRFGGETPKQYLDLAGKSVILRSIESILAHPRIKDLWVVIHPDDVSLFKKSCRNLTDTRFKGYIIGGKNRSDSVRNGLVKISTKYVLIHDGARPILPLDILENTIKSLEKNDAVFLALPINDALWNVKDDYVTTSQSRDSLWRAQTPQAFVTKQILTAHEAVFNNKIINLTDDVAVAKLAGINVSPVLGSAMNIKITHSQDLNLAQILLGKKMDIRTGIGYDVHAFGDGDHIILNGIKIPHNRALIGHSDADVGMHAITDALFGAVAEGDIGRWFPPSDPQWKGASSDIFLRKSVDIISKNSFKINNIDCTIICEMPKIAPYADAMRKNLAQIIGLDINRISIKATTSERLGFTGRGEGMAAQAIVTVVKI